MKKPLWYLNLCENILKRVLLDVVKIKWKTRLLDLSWTGTGGGTIGTTPNFLAASYKA